MAFFPALIPAFTTIAKAVNIVATTITAVTTIVTAVSRAFGLTKTDNPEELGQKALQAEEYDIRPDNFKTYEAYGKEVEALNLDPEKSSKWSKEQKEAKAFEIGSMLLTEKFGPNASVLIVDIARRPEFFTPERAKHYLETAKDLSIDLAKVSDLINNATRDLPSVVEAKDLMYDIEKSFNPSLTTAEHSKQVMEMRTEKFGNQ